MKAKRSAETNAKMIATRKRNQRLNRKKNGTVKADRASKDAIIYLRHARKDMTRSLRAGKIKEFDSAHLLALLALNSLAGG